MEIPESNGEAMMYYVLHIPTRLAVTIGPFARWRHQVMSLAKSLIIPKLTSLQIVNNTINACTHQLKQTIIHKHERLYLNCSHVKHNTSIKRNANVPWMTNFTILY